MTSSDDLYDFMRQLQLNLAAEYRRIQKRSREDPGLAGAQGEENWAHLLREWLPANYYVVTRGRVIDHRGNTSPEVDVLVLHPSYPRHLLDKKYYLSGGVVAAFECKLALRSSHLRKTIDTCAAVKRLSDARSGSPYLELNRTPIFGILAHTHEWRPKGVDGAFEITKGLSNKVFDNFEHPSLTPDVICVADTAAIYRSTDLLFGEVAKEKDAQELLAGTKHGDGIGFSYVCSWQDNDRPYLGTTLGTLVSTLMNRMAYEDASLRRLASYYDQSAFGRGGIDSPAVLSPEFLSAEVLVKLRGSGQVDQQWSEWSTWQ